MPASTAATLFGGILVGIAFGYAIWECVHAFFPPERGTTDLRVKVIQMSLQPPNGDYELITRLIDLYNFSYIMNQPNCTANVHALVLVPSAPGNRDRRKLIRQTWANFVELPLHKNSIPFRVIFLLGLPDTDEMQAELERENFEYDDMVQGSFFDTYENITYKHVMAMQWFLSYCSHSKILIKVDDDVFLNTPQLMIYLHNTMLHNELPQAPTAATNKISSTAEPNPVSNNTKSPKLLFRRQRDLLFCNRMTGVRVHRSYRFKWRVSYRDYPKSVFPPYCPGYGIIYSADVVQRLYDAAQKANFFWIDDIFITGFLAGQLNISIIPAQSYTVACTSGRPTCDELLDVSMNTNDLEFLFSYPPDSQQMHNMWRTQLRRARDHIETDVTKRISDVDSAETDLLYSDKA